MARSVGCMSHATPAPSPEAGYAPRTMVKAAAQRGGGLHACPFCRELFVDGEHDHCPECGVELRELSSLPLSAEAQALGREEEHAGVATAPEAEPLPWTDMSRGVGRCSRSRSRGIAVFFFAPFASFTAPANSTLTAFHMARSAKIRLEPPGRVDIVVPAVLSRRTILQMWGGRVACAFLPAVPGVYSLIALSGPTERASNIPNVVYQAALGAGALRHRRDLGGRHLLLAALRRPHPRRRLARGAPRPRLSHVRDRAASSREASRPWTSRRR